MLLTANEWEFFMSSGEDIGVDMSSKVVEWVRDKVRKWLIRAREVIDGVEKLIRKGDRKAVKARMELVLNRWLELEEGFQRWIRL